MAQGAGQGQTLISREADLPDAAVELFRSASHPGPVLAFRFFYDFLYYFLKKEHKKNDHLLQVLENDDEGNENCRCECVLDKSMELFIKDLNDIGNFHVVNASERLLASEHVARSNKLYVLLWDPFFSLPCSEELREKLKEHKVFFLESSKGDGAMGVEFMAGAYKKTIPVYLSEEYMWTMSTEFCTPSTCVSDVIQRLVKNEEKTSDDKYSCKQLTKEFFDTLAVLFREESAYVNSDFFTVLEMEIPYDKTDPECLKDMICRLNDLVTLQQSENPDAFHEFVSSPGKATLPTIDLESVIVVIVLNVVMGFYYPLIFNQDYQLNKVKKYYVIFPKSGKLKPQTNLLQREEGEDVNLKLNRAGVHYRSYTLHAYRNTRNKRIYYLEFPPLLSLCQQLREGEAFPVPVNSPSMKEVITRLKKAIKDESLSFRIEERLSSVWRELIEDPKCQTPMKTELLLDFVEIILTLLVLKSSLMAPMPTRVNSNTTGGATSGLHTFDEQVQLNPTTEADDHPNATIKLFKSAKHMGAAFAVRFFYGFLYHFLKRSHKRSDHLLPPIDGSEDEPCECQCVLDRSVDLFLKDSDLPSDAHYHILGDQSTDNSRNKRYLLICDPIFSKPGGEVLCKELRKLNLLVKLKNLQPYGTDGVEFLVNGYKKIIPVHYHRKLRRVIVAEFNTPSAVMGDTMLSIANQVDRTFHTHNLFDISVEFRKSLRLLLREEKDHVNTDFIRVKKLPKHNDQTASSIAADLEGFLTEDVDVDDDEPAAEDIQLDLESLVVVNVLNLLHGLLYPLTLNQDFLQKVVRYFVIFPKSGAVNPLLNLLQREETKDVIVRMRRTGCEDRQFQLHAYEDTISKQIYHMEFPPFLSFCQLLEGKECPFPVNSPAMKKAIGSLKTQLETSDEEISLSWLMEKRLSAFCTEFKDNLLENPECRLLFKTEYLRIIRWNDEQEPSFAERELLELLSKAEHTFD